jgi:hypothetical protein
MALGADVWDVVETRYIKPVVLASKDDKLEFIFNAKGMNAILNGLVEAKFVKVIVVYHFTTQFSQQLSLPLCTWNYKQRHLTQLNTLKSQSKIHKMLLQLHKP